MLKPGDKVVMVNCSEAEKYGDRVWTVRSEPWKLGCGEEVILLKGKSGGFSTKCLKKVEVKLIKVLTPNEYPDNWEVLPLNMGTDICIVDDSFNIRQCFTDDNGQQVQISSWHTKDEARKLISLLTEIL